jgi:hypothetical protein
VKCTQLNKTSPRKVLAGFVLTTALAWATPARAQLNGENLLGDMGVKSGSQPHPGVYVSAIYYRYRADSLRDAEGRAVNADPTGDAGHAINAGVPLVYWVTPKKVLGAQFAMMAVLPFANGGLEAPGFGLSETASTGMSDLYVMPAQLGWQTSRVDAIAGFAFFAPTGRYTAGASDNLGKGMWSFELSAGGTLYVDKQRSVSVSTTAYWETHTKKQGEVALGQIQLDDVKVGDILTLEGGVGKSFLNGAMTLGMAYYAQWKVTRDELGLLDSGVAAKHRVFGIGPDVTIPIATKTRLISLVNVRYLWEHGAQVKTQGHTLIVTSTFPVGGIKIPTR